MKKILTLFIVTCLIVMSVPFTVFANAISIHSYSQTVYYNVMADNNHYNSLEKDENALFYIASTGYSYLSSETPPLTDSNGWKVFDITISEGIEGKLATIKDTESNDYIILNTDWLGLYFEGNNAINYIDFNNHNLKFLTTYGGNLRFKSVEEVSFNDTSYWFRNCEEVNIMNKLDSESTEEWLYVPECVTLREIEHSGSYYYLELRYIPQASWMTLDAVDENYGINHYLNVNFDGTIDIDGEVTENTAIQVKYASLDKGYIDDESWKSESWDWSRLWCDFGIDTEPSEEEYPGADIVITQQTGTFLIGYAEEISIYNNAKVVLDTTGGTRLGFKNINIVDGTLEVANAWYDSSFSKIPINQFATKTYLGEGYKSLSDNIYVYTQPFNVTYKTPISYDEDNMVYDNLPNHIDKVYEITASEKKTNELTEVATTPKTGDDISFYMLLAMGGIGAFTLALALKRRNECEK